MRRHLPPKAFHVVQQRQSCEHTCHWPSCTKQVPPAMWGCKPHWFRLPAPIRERIWRAYRINQENDQRPSREYVKVAREAQDWIRENYGEGDG